MRSPITIALKVARQTILQRGDSGVIVQVDFIILDSPPEPLDEDVVQITTAPIHTDANTSRQKLAGKSVRSKLGSLVAVENERLTEGKSSVQGANTEVGVHRTGQLPSQNEAAKPVHDDDQIHKSSRHRDVGNVHTPNLVGLPDNALTQQIRPNFVVWMA